MGSDLPLLQADSRFTGFFSVYFSNASRAFA